MNKARHDCRQSGIPSCTPCCWPRLSTQPASRVIHPPMHTNMHTNTHLETTLLFLSVCTSASASVPAHSSDIPRCCVSSIPPAGRILPSDTDSSVLWLPACLLSSSSRPSLHPTLGLLTFTCRVQRSVSVVLPASLLLNPSLSLSLSTLLVTLREDVLGS